MARARRTRGPSGDPELTLPPEDFEPLDPEYHDLAKASLLLRLYAPAVYRATPTRFREVGPIERFDHQRPAADGRPRRDPGRGILYAAPSLLCCVGEYFGDQGEIALPGVRLARLTVVAPLRLLDLRGTAATGAGTIPAISAITRRATTQAWARWWYEHPQLAGVDGLLYDAANSGATAVAVTERARGKVVCRRGHHWPLSEPRLADELEVAAHRLRLAVAP